MLRVDPWPHKIDLLLALPRKDLENRWHIDKKEVLILTIFLKRQKQRAKRLYLQAQPIRLVRVQFQTLSDSWEINFKALCPRRRQPLLDGQRNLLYHLSELGQTYPRRVPNTFLQLEYLIWRVTQIK